MATNRYDVSDQVRLWGTFTANAVGTDPTNVYLEVYTPANVKTTYTFGTGAVIVKQATGTYYADVVLDRQGMWQYRWIGSGNIIVSEDNYLYSRRRPF